MGSGVHFDGRLHRSLGSSRGIGRPRLEGFEGFKHFPKMGLFHRMEESRLRGTHHHKDANLDTLMPHHKHGDRSFGARPHHSLLRKTARTEARPPEGIPGLVAGARHAVGSADPSPSLGASRPGPKSDWRHDCKHAFSRRTLIDRQKLAVRRREAPSCEDGAVAPARRVGAPGVGGTRATGPNLGPHLRGLSLSECHSWEMRMGIREGETPSEPRAGIGSHGGSPSRGSSGPFLRGAVLRVAGSTR